MAGLLALPLFFAPGATASAQGIERLGDFDSWSAYRFVEDGKPACYMASVPGKSEGDYSKRGDVYALVTHRPAESRRDEVSFVAGYEYKADSVAKVTIGDRTEDFFTQNDGAWTPDHNMDKEMVQAMIRGTSMVVKGTSSRGTLTTDTYSLKGFTSAYRAISKSCGVN
jgi:hypothetical protein